MLIKLIRMIKNFSNSYAVLSERIISAVKKIWPMKFRYSKTFYSQDGEDTLLYSFYENQPECTGFYLDIGAYHPFKFSNTALFYNKGWRGINIDATPNSMKLFKKYRKKDINLECAISDSQEELTYYSFTESALNTLDEKMANEYIKLGWELKEAIPVQTCPINDVLDKYLPTDQKIDFINIDIEGLELSILESFDFEKYAPKYFLIEELDYVDSDFMDYVKSDIYKLLKSKGYDVIAKTRRTVVYQNNDLILQHLPVVRNKDNSFYEPFFEELNQNIAKRVDIGNFKYVKQIIIEINNICNYSKEHKNCPVHHFKEKNILQTEAIHKVLDELSSINYQGIILFSIYNEPMTDARFYDLCRLAKEKCPNCVLYLLTNGFYLRDNTTIADLEKVGVDFISISAYSLSEYERFKHLKSNVPISINPMILDRRLNIYERECINCKSTCSAPFSDLSINSKGEVILCCLDFKASVVFGNIYNESLIDIVNSEQITNAHKNLSEGNRVFDICKRCDWCR